MNLELYDDTSSEVISIFGRDIRDIVINSSAQAPYISTGFIVGMENSMMPNINLALEIALVDENHNRVWTGLHGVSLCIQEQRGFQATEWQGHNYGRHFILQQPPRDRECYTSLHVVVA